MRTITKMALLSTGFLLAGSVLAKPDTTRVPVTNTRSGKVVTIPAHAQQVAPDVFSLGTAQADGKIVEGIMHVFRKEHAKGGVPGKPGGTTTSSCYAYLAKDAKWKSVEPWVINGANSGLDTGFLLSNTAMNIQKWEDAAGADIMGEGSLTSDALVADQVSPDGLNEIYFGEISEPGVIAVTITWGIFGGPPKARELIEMDQVFSTGFPWSDSGAAGAMDYENISTHELGHGLGMGHPDDSCTEETMYRFADYGETKKRDLNPGDIAGIAKLY